MVDLDGARSSHVINWGVLERLSSRTSLKIDFGGGIKTDDDLHIVFESGAAMATVGSIAIKDKELFKSWMFAYGPEKIILGADVKDGMIAISGWQEVTDIGDHSVPERISRIWCETSAVHRYFKRRHAHGSIL